MSIEGPIEYTMEEAAELLNFGEIGVIERHFGRNFGENMSPMQQLSGVVWAHRRRRLAAGEQFDWADVEKLSMKEASQYFAPDEPDVDAQAPETAPGKGDSPAG